MSLKIWGTPKYLEDLRLNRNSYVPEGYGMEVDYDKYNHMPNKHYPSAEAWWKKFCLNGETELKQSEIKEELLAELSNDRYLAMAVNHFVGKSFKSWLNKEGIDDLGGLTPKQCLKSEYGKKRLRMLFLTAA